MTKKSDKINQTLLKLNKTVLNKRKDSTCLKLWSKFIRFRDGCKCMECGSTSKVAAHHIIRKCFLPEAKFLTGNGITLCKSCHTYVHGVFNRKPDLSQPMDAQNGEKIEIITTLFGILSIESNEIGSSNLKHYYLSEQVLCKFKLFQDFDPFEFFPGTPIEQAYFIWVSCPLNVKNALLESNGFTGSPRPILPGITVMHK